MQKTKSVALILGVLAMSFLVGHLVLAWAEPMTTPPGSNVPVPLNVGNVGQSKVGGLILNTGGASIGLIVDKGNVGIGTMTPNNLLSVYGLIDFNNTDFNTKLGYQAGKNIVAGAVNNTFVGYLAGLSSAAGSTDAADNNTAVGYQSLYSNTTGNNNTAMGLYALRANTTGYYNTANGVYALYSNTTGNYNTANGKSALYSNTTGSENTTNGYASLYANTTGSANTANGKLVLYSNTTGSENTANGYASLYSNTTGNYNTANGFASLRSNTTGSNNSALGHEAGRYIADGSTANVTSYDSLYLGRLTKALASGDGNEIVIGFNATGVGSNSVVLGNDSITKTILKGNVGIGTTNPQYKLDVEGYVQANGYYTGDIIFQKDEEKLWRMYEGDDGLYLENLKTGKHYKFLIEEVKNR